MNISGIRPISGFYYEKSAEQVNRPQEVAAPTTKDTEVNSRGKAFGTYDVVRQHKPSEGIRVKAIDRVFSRAEVSKAVDVMKRDGSLHKYQTFVGVNKREPLIRSNKLENFTL